MPWSKGGLGVEHVGYMFTVVLMGWVYVGTREESIDGAAVRGSEYFFLAFFIVFFILKRFKSHFEPRYRAALRTAQGWQKHGLSYAPFVLAAACLVISLLLGRSHEGHMNALAVALDGFMFACYLVYYRPFVSSTTPEDVERHVDKVWQRCLRIFLVGVFVPIVIAVALSAAAGGEWDLFFVATGYMVSDPLLCLFIMRSGLKADIFKKIIQQSTLRKWRPTQAAGLISHQVDMTSYEAMTNQIVRDSVNTLIHLHRNAGGEGSGYLKDTIAFLDDSKSNDEINQRLNSLEQFFSVFRKTVPVATASTLISSGPGLPGTQPIVEVSPDMHHVFVENISRGQPASTSFPQDGFISIEDIKNLGSSWIASISQKGLGDMRSKEDFSSLGGFQAIASTLTRTNQASDSATSDASQQAVDLVALNKIPYSMVTSMPETAFFPRSSSGSLVRMDQGSSNSPEVASNTTVEDRCIASSGNQSPVFGKADSGDQGLGSSSRNLGQVHGPVPENMTDAETNEQVSTQEFGEQHQPLPNEGSLSPGLGSDSSRREDQGSSNSPEGVWNTTVEGRGMAFSGNQSPVFGKADSGDQGLGSSSRNLGQVDGPVPKNMTEPENNEISTQERSVQGGVVLDENSSYGIPSFKFALNTFKTSWAKAKEEMETGLNNFCIAEQGKRDAIITEHMGHEEELYREVEQFERRKSIQELQNNIDRTASSFMVVKMLVATLVLYFSKKDPGGVFSAYLAASLCAQVGSLSFKESIPELSQDPDEDTRAKEDIDRCLSLFPFSL